MGLFERTLNSPDAAYRDYMEKLTQDACASFAELHNSTTPAQRSKAVETLHLRYEQDFKVLTLHKAAAKVLRRRQCTSTARPQLIGRAPWSGTSLPSSAFFSSAACCRRIGLGRFRVGLHIGILEIGLDVLPGSRGWLHSCPSPIWPAGRRRAATGAAGIRAIRCFAVAGGPRNGAVAAAAASRVLVRVSMSVSLDGVLRSRDFHFQAFIEEGTGRACQIRKGKGVHLKGRHAEPSEACHPPLGLVVSGRLHARTKAKYMRR
jgi:hypothetical protein